MRYNIFFRVHQGLRSLLFETALQLQRTDFSYPAEATGTLELLSEVLILFDRHAQTEDELLFPMLQPFEPSVQDAFEKEHQKDSMLASLLAESMKLYAGADTNAERLEVGRTIRFAFEHFLLFNLEHMSREESVLNPLLWKYYEDEELYRLTARIVAETPPEYQPLFNQWMLRGLNDAEILSWIRQVEPVAPAPAFDGLLQLAASQLPASRYRKLLEGIKDATWLG